MRVLVHPVGGNSVASKLSERIWAFSAMVVAMANKSIKPAINLFM
jgi:hypothetical protein